MGSADSKFVTIGGGTGSFMLLSALKRHVANITAIVNMADSGGSTGILRDELGVLPPGDVRQCLVALAPASSEIRELFNYRFGDGSLSGHSFGNLFLTALEKMTGSFDEAVKAAGRILNVSGSVVPSTLDDVELVYDAPNGERIVGESSITPRHFVKGERPRLSLLPAAQLNPEAAAAIADADVIVVAPGNLYSSLAPTLMVRGMGEAIAASGAKVIYVCNLVTKPGQTDGFAVHDFAAEVERFAGRPILDYVIYNTHHPSKALLKNYAQHGEYAVQLDQKAAAKAVYQVVPADLLSDTVAAPDPNDKLLKRTLIRHDGEKAAREIIKIDQS